MMPTRHRIVLLLVTSILSACSAPAPAPVAPAAPVAAAPATPPAPVPKSPAAAPGTVRLAPRDPTLEAWKRSAAERIHAANRAQLFEGRPHHLLQAVIVVEATVDRSGQVVSSRITRSPGIKSLDQKALASLKLASPLPAPPAALLVRGNLVFSETWLVQNDGSFQVRTLALPQE
jgi:periplasmic protein TonB